MKKIFYLLLILLFISCGKSTDDKELNKRRKNYGRKGVDYSKPMSWGNKQDIICLADGPVWKYAKEIVKENLERQVYTTLNESYFKVMRKDSKQIDYYIKHKNILFFCNLESTDYASAYVKKFLGEKIIKEVKKNRIGLYTNDNMWSNDQRVIIVVGNNLENLLKLNFVKKREMFNFFKDKLEERIENEAYGMKLLPKVVFKDLPFTLDIPESYLEYRKKLSKNYISWIRRRESEGHDKFLSVYYEDMQEDNVNKNWLVKTRLKVFGEVYEGDKFNNDNIIKMKSEVAGFNGYKISGRWHNDEFYVGGAFSSFAFYDKKNKKAYLIDNTVFYPNGHKLKSLIELERISNSFKIK